jgi:hypothetical protein
MKIILLIIIITMIIYAAYIDHKLKTERRATELMTLYWARDSKQGRGFRCIARKGIRVTNLGGDWMIEVHGVIIKGNYRTHMDAILAADSVV